MSIHTLDHLSLRHQIVLLQNMRNDFLEQVALWNDEHPDLHFYQFTKTDLADQIANVEYEMNHLIEMYEDVKED